jgi:hypothetical protein
LGPVSTKGYQPGNRNRHSPQTCAGNPEMPLNKLASRLSKMPLGMRGNDSVTFVRWPFLLQAQ